MLVSSLAVFTLTLGAITGIGVLPAAADTETVTLNNITYSGDPVAVSAGATVTAYDGAGGAVEIPASVTINGVEYAVKAIGEDAFRGKALTDVTIPDSVTTIGESAFANNLLESVKIPDSVTSLGAWAFLENDLTSVDIGAGVPSIGNFTFSYNELTTVTIPNKVTSIGAGAFQYNDLTSVTIGSKVATIGNYAFVDNDLATVAIPNSVTSIGATAFSRNKLKTVTLGTGLTLLGEGAFAENLLTKVTIPSTVTSIGASAFTNNELTSVAIPSNVTTIGDSAFLNNDLAKLTIPTSVENIGDYAFSGNALKSVIIPDSVTTIGTSAFVENQLQTVTIGNGVTRIGTAAFQQNPVTALTLGSNVTSIGDFAFYVNKLAKVTIPDSVETIGEFAFTGNGSTSVSLGSSVRQIGVSAFAINNLATVTIPNSVTTIGQSAFHLNQLTSVTLGSSVTTVGGAAFSLNNLLSSVLFLGAPPTTVSAADAEDPSFGGADGKKFYYLPAYASDFGETWNGYTAAEATAFPTRATPEIRGAAKVGQALTARLSRWAPTPILGYEWKHSGELTVLGRNATYTPTADDLGKALIVTVTGYAFTHTDGVVTGVAARTVSSVETTAVALGTFAPAPTPLVSGTKQVGKILTVDPGDWPDDATLTYQWKRAGVALAGETATKSRYAVVAGDLGRKLSVTVIATIPGYTNTVVTSAATTAIASGAFGLTPIPVVTGTAQVGDDLTALPGTWPSGATLTYTWKRSGSTAAISTSTDGRYTPVNADIGKTLTVTVTATRNGFTTVSKTSVATVKVIGSPFTTVVPTISGASDDMAAVGTTLTAVTGVWDPVPTTFTYVWKRTTTANVTTVISGATKSSYKVASADLGKTITVTVTGSKTLFATESVTSESPGVLIGSAT